jgi:biotin carboxyl carrier protein
VPETGRQRERQPGDSATSRQADHAGIARLTEELLPALIAKLSTTQLGELEVREGDWHVRLRRPYGVVPGEDRRVTDKPWRTQAGHEGHRPARSSGATGSSAQGGTGGASGITAGSGAASASSNGTGGTRTGAAQAGDAADRSRTIATSPAVGTFTPGPRAASGTRVRAGDSLGTVDVLGIPQDVSAPADGIVGQTLVEAGMAVEYGQELIRLELTEPAEARGS